MSGPRYDVAAVPSDDGKNVMIVATVHDAEGVVSQSAIRIPGAQAKDFIAKLTAAAVKVTGARLVVAQKVPKLIQ